MINRLILIGFLASGCVASACEDPPTQTNQETNDMVRRPTASRRPPANIEPVILNGVRFEQVLDTTGIDTEDHNGWMRATSVESGDVLWTRQIYAVPFDETKERGVQRIYFKSLSVGPGGAFLIVENEASKRFQVDPESGDSTLE